MPGSNNVTPSYIDFYTSQKFSSATFTLKPTDETTIGTIIRNISTNAQGIDGINLEMIIQTLPHTLNIITSIINQSITTGVVPDIWKQAIVKPIPKTSDPVELKDLRPISLLPFMSKVLERVVCNQVTKYLEANNILPAKQSGFRAGRSTATALLDVVDDILAAQDAGKGTVLVLLDFSRAFDTINPSLLLSKLAYYGFDEDAIKWFTSYLDGRTQRVEVCTDSNGTKSVSTSSSVTRGIPQGSILGPILFILYCSDICDSIKYCSHHLYADDLQVYLSFEPNETQTAVQKLNDDLER